MEYPNITYTRSYRRNTSYLKARHTEQILINGIWWWRGGSKSRSIFIVDDDELWRSEGKATVFTDIFRQTFNSEAFNHAYLECKELKGEAFRIHYETFLYTKEFKLNPHKLNLGIREFVSVKYENYRKNLRE